MALKVGSRGLWLEIGMYFGDYGRLRLRAAADCGPFHVSDGGLQDVGVYGGVQQCIFNVLTNFPWTINNQFRTVSDKGNPTV